jgi:L-threonylcarbamoyladenylate synthase
MSTAKPPLWSPSLANLELAAQKIRDGDLVAFPTETVYGLGADATNGQAVAKIFASKNRPAINPLITHGFSVEQLQDYAHFDARALQLAASFWPGPLSFILPRSTRSPLHDLVSAGLDTLAVRIPNHKVALDLLRTAQTPIAAPSANKSGTLSPTAPFHVLDQFTAHEVSGVLAAGNCQIGLESSVVD